MTPREWGLIVFAGSLLKLAAITTVLCELVGRVGAGLLGWWRNPERGALERFGFGLLLGWTAVGLSYFGLALTGLYSALALGIVLLALIAGSRAIRDRKLLLVEAARATRPFWPELWILALAVAPVVVFLCAPEAGWDGYVYHLGVPWQFLQSHRAVFTHVPVGFQLSLPVEMTFAIPLVLGDERLARWIIASFVAAATAVYWARCLRAGRTRAAWLGPLLTLAAAETLSLATECKNDLAAASLIVAGALVFQRGRRSFGALLLGLGIAAKPVYGPLAVLWAGLYLTWRAPFFWIAAGLGVPSLPWWMKSALLAGGPGFPTSWFSQKVYWVKGTPIAAGASFPETWIAHRVPMWGPGTLSHVPVAWLDLMARDHLPVVLLLFGALWVSRQRRGLAACLLAQAILLAIVDVPRFLVAAQWLLALLLVEDLERLPRGLPRMAPLFAAAAALAHLVTLPGLTWADAAGAFTPGAGAPAGRYGTYLATAREVGALGSRRVLLVGEPRTYRMPGRAFYEGTLGETPWLWRIIHESVTVDELNRKWRQLGAPVMAYNFVAANYHIRMLDDFVWNPRMIALYAEFVRRHLTVLRAPAEVDHAHGGYYLYVWHARPAARPAPPLYLPGAEDAFAEPQLLVQQGNFAGAAASLRAIAVNAPDVAHLASMRGDLEWLLGRSDNAYRSYREAAVRGLVDLENWSMLGDAAQATSRFEESSSAYQVAVALYPDQRPVIDPKRATLEFRRAERFRTAGRLAPAEAAYRNCLDSLGRIPASPDRTTAEALALVRLAGVLVRLDRLPEARQRLTAAFQVMPGAIRDPEARRLSALVAR